ncbi:hypothetical protein ASF49_01655 [Methylobacterium sp. Leaf104]|nr:hypothetical protein ASF49_01655 [Methylobacterium sp. Leaf104]
MSARRAEPAVRKQLLQSLGAPTGSVTVMRRATPDGDVIVVRMNSKSSVRPERQVSAFKEFPVVYEVMKPVVAGHW